MSLKLKKTLYLGCAAVMLTGVGASSSASFATQGAPVRASRKTKHIHKYIRKHSHKRNKDAKDTKVSHWKSSWNKYLRGDTRNIWFLSKYFSGRGSSLDKAQQAQRRASEKSEWAKFIRDHSSKKSFSNSRISYPTYDYLTHANNNAKSEQGGSMSNVSFPPLWNHWGGRKTKSRSTNPKNWHVKDQKRNGELFGNWPLTGFTSSMLSKLHQVAIPAHNGKRPLNSFRAWMSRNHDHPKLKFGRHDYVYNGQDFVDEHGTNGKGKTYQFNSKTNHYQRVSTKRASRKAKRAIHNNSKEIHNLQKTAAKYHVGRILHNPALNKATKQVVRSMIVEQQKPAKNLDKAQQAKLGEQQEQREKKGQQSQNANLTSGQFTGFWDDPVNVYDQLSQNSQISPSQRARLKYMAQTLVSQQKSNSDQTSSTVDADISALDANGAFKGMSHSKKGILVKYLMTHLSALASAMKEYGLDTDVNYSKQPTSQAKQASGHVKNSSDDQNSDSMITSNQAEADNQDILVQQIKQLVKLLDSAD